MLWWARDAEWIILAAKNRNLTHREEPHHTWASHTCSPHTHLCWNGDDECEETVLAKEWVWDLCVMFWVEFKRSWVVSEEMRRLEERCETDGTERSVGRSQFWFTKCKQGEFLNQSQRLSWKESLTYILCVKIYINLLLKDPVKSGTCGLGF